MPKGTYDPQTHTYKRQGQVLVSVTDALKEAGLVETWGTAFHLSRGQATHASIAYHLENDLNWATVDPVVLPYVRAAQACLRDLKPERIIAVERSLFHPTLPIAGTPDLVLRHHGVRLLLDFQSGGMSPSKALQTALYEWLGRAPCQRWGVQLLPNEQYRLHPFRERSDHGVGLTAIYKALDARGVDPTSIFGVRLTEKQIAYVLDTWRTNHGDRPR